MPALQTLLLWVLLVCSASSCISATKVWYGVGYRLPPPKKSIESVKPFFSTVADKTGKTTLTAVGVVWTKALLGDTVSIPVSSTPIPVPNGNFNFTGSVIPFTFNSQDPTGPNPSSNATDVSLPFQFVRTTYAASGFPTNGNTASFVGVYTTPLWAVSFHLDDLSTWARYFSPAASGPCVGLTKALFNRTMLPVASKCYPGGRFANTGDVMPASGATILDLGAPEWSTVQGSLLTNTTVQYGQFNGAIEYLQILITQDFLNNQTNELRCKDIKFLPQALPAAQLFPTQYCLRNVGTTVVLDLRNFKTIPAGDCNISATNPATANSFYPSAFVPPYLDASCLTPMAPAAVSNATTPSPNSTSPPSGRRSSRA